MDNTRPIICDTGTGYLKIGWAGDNFPAHMFPTMVGRPMLRFDEKIEGVELKSIMVGDEAAPLRSMLELSHPIDEGIVKDWDDMERIWEYGFKKMGADLTESRVLMTEAALNPIKNREKTCQILFEKFKVDKLQMGIQALLAIFAEGLLSATVLDSGDGVTHCIPIIEGRVFKAQIERLNLAGRHVTQYLTKLLLLRGYAFNSTADFETVREIKEKSCFVSCDIKLDRKLSKETTTHMEEYRLPDQTLIKIEKERFEASELLFNPGYAGFEMRGCHELVFDCINNCPIDCRKTLYENIVLSGGTTMFAGFPTRLENEIVNLYRTVIQKGADVDLPFDIEVKDSPRRKYNVFIGGGVFANTMNNHEGWWITRKDWEEQGPRCLKNLSNSLML